MKTEFSSMQQQSQQPQKSQKHNKSQSQHMENPRESVGARAVEEVSRTLEHTVESTKSTMHSAAQTTRSTLRRSAEWMAGYLREYPSLRVFFYVFVVLSGIPMALMAAYTLVTALGTLAAASVGVLLVEGGLLALGSTVFLPTLGVCSLMSLGITAAYTATRVVTAIARVTFNRLSENTNQLGMGKERGSMMAGMMGTS